MPAVQTSFPSFRFNLVVVRVLKNATGVEGIMAAATAALIDIVKVREEEPVAFVPVTIKTTFPEVAVGVPVIRPVVVLKARPGEVLMLGLIE